jgi:hypothetical protein
LSRRKASSKLLTKEQWRRVMNDQAEEHQQLIARCWEDEAFKRRLKADPLGTLRRAGISIPNGMTVKVLEDSEQVMHLVIPAKPKMLADELLEDTAGGGWVCHAWSAGG